MMAHGIANELNRKLLLINFPSLYSDSKTTEMLLNMTFREAKIQNAIVFFDECEPSFASRDTRISGNSYEIFTDIFHGY